MVIVGLERPRRFTRSHADARNWIENWVAMTRTAEWEGPADIRREYASISVLSGNRFVFNVKGNRYRMLVQVAFNTKRVVVLKIGTHAEYDRWKL